MYLIQALNIFTGTAFTDTVCADCADGTYSNGSLMACQPHSKWVVFTDLQILIKNYSNKTGYTNIELNIFRCEIKGLTEIKAGTTPSDAECEKVTSVELIVGVGITVTVTVLVAVLVALIAYIIYRKSKACLL